MVERSLAASILVILLANGLSAQQHETEAKTGSQVFITMTGELATEYARRTGTHYNEKHRSGLGISTVAMIDYVFDDGGLRIAHSAEVGPEEVFQTGGSEPQAYRQMGSPTRLVTLTGIIDPRRITTHVSPIDTLQSEDPNSKQAQSIVKSKLFLLELDLPDLKELNLRTWTLSEKTASTKPPATSDSAKLINVIEQWGKRIQEPERPTAKPPQGFLAPTQVRQYPPMPSPEQSTSPHTAFSIGSNQSYLPSIYPTNPEVPIIQPPQVGSASDKDSEIIQSTTFEAITVDGNEAVLVSTRGVRITVKSLSIEEPGSQRITHITASPKGIIMKSNNQLFTMSGKFESIAQLTITKMDLIRMEVVPQEK